MSGSIQAVSGRVPPSTVRLGRRLLRQAAAPLLTIVAVLSTPSFVRAAEAPGPLAPATQPAAERHRERHPVSRIERPVTLVGIGARDLLDDGLLGSTRLPPTEDSTPFEFPQITTTNPVAIPFPTAVHLFIPGAILAMYATRRFRGRRR